MMTDFTNEIYADYNDSITAKQVLKDIKKYIPHKTVCEPFVRKGHSTQYLKELGFDVINSVSGVRVYKGCIVTTPRFSEIPEVLEWMTELDVPFILIMPSTVKDTEYFKNMFDNKMQFIIPKKRIEFTKWNEGPLENGGRHVTGKTSTFECFYYCYRMNLEKDITQL